MWVRIWESWYQIGEWIKHVKHSSYGKNSDNQITIELTFIERTSTDLNKCRSHLKLVSNCHKSSENEGMGSNLGPVLKHCWRHIQAQRLHFDLLRTSYSDEIQAVLKFLQQVKWNTSCIKLPTARGQIKQANELFSLTLCKKIALIVTIAMNQPIDVGNTKMKFSIKRGKKLKPRRIFCSMQ